MRQLKRRSFQRFLLLTTSALFAGNIYAEDKLLKLDPTAPSTSEPMVSTRSEPNQPDAQQLIILLDDLNDSSKSRAVLNGSIPENYCRLEGDVYTPTSIAPQFKNDARAALEKRAITPEKAETTLKEIEAMADIPHAFLESGCESRAHVIADRLKKNGIPVQKIWAQGGSLNPTKESNSVWQFHVAVSVPVKKSDGAVEWQVLDPSLASRPQTVDRWLARFKAGDSTPPLRVTWPVPNAARILARTNLFFTPSDIYLPVSALPQDPDEPDTSLSDSARINARNLSSLKALNQAYEQGHIERPKLRIEREAP